MAGPCRVQERREVGLSINTGFKVGDSGLLKSTVSELKFALALFVAGYNVFVVRNFTPRLHTPLA